MSECHCIAGEGRFRLKVESFDCKHLWITDRSEWQVEGLYVIPPEFVIEITLPGAKHGKEYVIKTGVENQIKVSEATFINDGLYCFKVFTCGIKQTIFRAITCKLECCLRQLIHRADPGDKQIEDLITRARIWLDKIHLSAESGAKDVAVETLHMLRNELLKFNCDC